MKVRNLLLSFLISLLGTICLDAQDRTNFGAFMSCEMACQAILIRSNGTFQRLLDGDLYNDERVDGQWERLERNRIKAWSAKPSGPPKVTESKEERDGLLVIVTDFVGGLVPGTEISGVADGKPIRCTTNVNGACAIPRTKEFEIKWAQYTGKYIIENLYANVFRVELSVEQMQQNIVDDIWIVEDNFLYFERNGKIERDYRLERLSRRKQQKVFPNSTKQ